MPRCEVASEPACATVNSTVLSQRGDSPATVRRKKGGAERKKGPEKKLSCLSVQRLFSHAEPRSRSAGRSLAALVCAACVQPGSLYSFDSTLTAALKSIKPRPGDPVQERMDARAFGPQSKEAGRRHGEHGKGPTDDGERAQHVRACREEDCAGQSHRRSVGDGEGEQPAVARVSDGEAELLQGWGWGRGRELS